ncbi:hypothetical protein [Tateyamaria sp. syn59]|uniref:hypothetical protein n=1 Tax=Tateyamaria sp. syn59 TaxID=2576942 RepID=UPI001CB98C23|nr:hypothetical protein [Tateyamaria sp. syn59]
MKSLVVTTAMSAVLLSTPAFAGDETDITQLMSGVQKALNSIAVNHNNTGIEQSGTNAANLISWDGASFDDLSQSATGATKQLAKNSASTTYGQWNDLTQGAVNLINSIDIGNASGVDVQTVMQNAIGTDQDAINVAQYGQWVDGVAQNALNAANLFTGNDVEDLIEQKFDASQLASNDISGADNNEWARDIESIATNVVNSISADDIEEAVQIAKGNQAASNYVNFGNGDTGFAPSTADLDNVIQTAMSAANMITIDDLDGSSSQTASLSQLSENVAAFTGAVSSPAHNAGRVSGLTQTATNAGNIMTANSLPSTSGVLEVNQVSSAMQTATNALAGQGALNNVTQAATNVANSVGMPAPSL